MILAMIPLARQIPRGDETEGRTSLTVGCVVVLSEVTNSL